MVKNSSTISSKGQITVPLAIRHRLGLREGDRIEFVVEDGQTIFRPARLAGNPFEKYVGALRAFKDKGQINRWVTSLREDDETREDVD